MGIFGFWDLKLGLEAEKAVKEYEKVQFFEVGQKELIRYLALPITQ
jgi:hypothetical protein